MTDYNKNGKIFIGMPRERVMYSQFVDNRDNVLARLGAIDRLDGFGSMDGHRVDKNRDYLVEEFLARPNKPEWLLMLDTDMEHPPTAPERLTSYGIPIVGALYFHRASHEPFAYRYSGIGKDEYGRPKHQWISMRDTVYDFLEANNIPMADGQIALPKYEGQAVIKCDAVATGCMVVHRSVFEQIEPPWFEYIPGGNSEDLIFCKKARDIGLEVAIDLSTICGHYHIVPMGQAQFRMSHEQRGVGRAKASTTDSAETYAKFYDISVEKAKEEIEAASGTMLKDLWLEWREKNPDTDPREFYMLESIGKSYLLELIVWNGSTSFLGLQSTLIRIRNRSVVEIGSGIGTLAIQMACQRNNVIAVEINDVLRNYSKARWNDVEKDDDQEAHRLKIIGPEWKGRIKPESQDVVLCFDVLEHMSESEVKSTMSEIHRILKLGGRLAYHANWYQQDLYPMHYNHSEWFEKYCNDLGFISVAEIEMIKAR